MSVRLASFYYEDERYFVTLDNGYLQQTFSGKNAVSIMQVQIDAGLSAAIAQPWGSYRPATCPVSEDAQVVKVGDNFIVHGTCGGYRFELNEMSYTIEDEESSPESKEVAPEEIFECGPVPEQEEAIVTEEVVVEEPAIEEESVIEEQNIDDRMYGMCIGAVRGGSFQRNKEIQEHNHVPSSLIVNPVMRSADPYRGVRIGRSLSNDNTLQQMPVSQWEHTSDENKKQSDNSTRNNQINRTPMDLEYITQHADAEVMLRRDESLHDPVETELNFEGAPKPSGTDFDCQEFLSELSVDQITFLSGIPTSLLGSISEFTRDQISVNKLESLGAIYCTEHKWKFAEGWYAIDEIQTLSRYVYCESTGNHQRIPTKTLKGWNKCIEAGLVG